MKKTYIIAFACSLSLSLSSCASQPTEHAVVPLVRAHAHNDYRHDRPLHDALAHGFTGIEADVFLVDDAPISISDHLDIARRPTIIN